MCIVSLSRRQAIQIANRTRQVTATGVLPPPVGYSSKCARAQRARAFVYTVGTTCVPRLLLVSRIVIYEPVFDADNSLQQLKGVLTQALSFAAVCCVGTEWLRQQLDSADVARFDGRCNENESVIIFQLNAGAANCRRVVLCQDASLCAALVAVRISQSAPHESRRRQWWPTVAFLRHSLSH